MKNIKQCLGQCKCVMLFFLNVFHPVWEYQIKIKEKDLRQICRLLTLITIVTVTITKMDMINDMVIICKYRTKDICDDLVIQSGPFVHIVS